jgi:hypothetical protein
MPIEGGLLKKSEVYNLKLVNTTVRRETPKKPLTAKGAKHTRRTRADPAVLCGHRVFFASFAVKRFSL